MQLWKRFENNLTNQRSSTTSAPPCVRSSTPYAENKGMIWLIGLLITAASAAWGFYKH
jgi:hypothetical protein